MKSIYEHRDIPFFIGEMTHYPVPVHLHEVSEIVCLTAGHADIRINGIPYTLDPGDVAVFFPLTPHSYEFLSEDIGGVTAIFSPDTVSEYYATFRVMVPEEPVIRKEHTGKDLRMAVERLGGLDMEKEMPLCVAYLHVMLADVMHRLTYQSVYDFSEQNLGQKILHYVSEHACEEITLESAAHAMGISASHLSHFFAEKLHIHFRRYINSIRIEKARMMMRDPGMTLTMISDACGYTSMRTFRRAFLSEAGELPSDSMQAIRRSALKAETQADDRKPSERGK